MKNLWLALALLIHGGSTLFGNGGAWQAGVPATGNASASKNDRHTDVTIENEILKIDLHPEYADVTVRYRMHNTGPRVQQDFFFPVERWGANPDADWIDVKSDNIDRYQISVDGKQLKWTNLAGPKEKSSETKKETSEDNQESGKERRLLSRPSLVLKGCVRDYPTEAELSLSASRAGPEQNVRFCSSLACDNGQSRPRTPGADQFSAFHFLS